MKKYFLVILFALFLLGSMFGADSFYAIKCINGEEHPAISNPSLKYDGPQPGHFPKDVQDRVTELYVLDDDDNNRMLFTDYSIPYSKYPKNIGY